MPATQNCNSGYAVIYLTTLLYTMVV